MKKLSLLLMSLFVVWSTYAVTPLTDGEIYYIKSEKTGGVGSRNAQFLTIGTGDILVFEAKTAAGAAADNNCKWKVTAAGTDGYYIQNLGNSKYVTFDGTKSINGVKTADKNDANSKVILLDGSTVTIDDFSIDSYGIESAANSGLVMDVYANNEGHIGVWDWAGGEDNRRFLFMTQTDLDEFEAALPPPPPSSLPYFSTDTGAGAIWYIMENDKNDDEDIRPWVPNGLNQAFGIRFGELPNKANEDELWCFVGDNVTGFKIYNKTYLKGNVVDGVTLTEDLPVQTIGVRAGTPGAYEWWDAWPLGFTNATPVSGYDLMDTFLMREGDGSDHDGVERVGYFKVFTTKFTGGDYAESYTTIRLSGSSDAELTLNLDWGDSYHFRFQYVEGNIPDDYTITINNGTAKANGKAGETISITANAAPSGKIFDKWESDDVTFANATNATTTFIMPAKNVTVTATYKEDTSTTPQILDNAKLKIDGNIVTLLLAAEESADIYTATGLLVKQIAGTGSFVLEPGFYIVKIGSVTGKILIK